ncbi:hypothetical protein [Streptomyces sp. NPDC048411]
MELSLPLNYAGDPREASGATMLNVIPAGPDPARLISTVKNWL